MTEPLYLVAGLGKTGLSIARYLHAQHKPFIVYDTRPDAPGMDEFQAEFPHNAVYLGDFPEDQFRHITDVITSPGIPLEHPVLQMAKQQGAAIYGDIECLARQISAPVIAITGTNGKSTVTTLVGEMAKAAGYKVAVAGNIGTPVLDTLRDEHQYGLWVLELSSFQLDLTASLKPKAVSILNISPDHLDRHHTMPAYIAAKQRIYEYAQIALYNREDRNTKPEGQAHPPRQLISFGQDMPDNNNWGLSKEGKQVYITQGTTKFFPVEQLRIKGVHNWLNAMAAIALADAAGIAADAIKSVLESFSGLPHRCEWVRSLDGVDWINDSKGTNIGATISAINGIGGSMQGKIVLIAGGQGKGADFSELRQAIGDFVRSIVLIGEDADKIEAALQNTVPMTRATNLDSAVALAKEQAKPGDVVLLSPACASLDMFRDFNHRGDVFMQLVHGM